MQQIGCALDQAVARRKLFAEFQEAAPIDAFILEIGAEIVQRLRLFPVRASQSARRLGPRAGGSRREPSSGRTDEPNARAAYHFFDERLLRIAGC